MNKYLFFLLPALFSNVLINQYSFYLKYVNFAFKFLSYGFCNYSQNSSVHHLIFMPNVRQELNEAHRNQFISTWLKLMKPQTS